MSPHASGTRFLCQIFATTVFVLFFNSSFSQEVLSVDNATGTANVTIPLYTVSVGDISSPVALTYSASGLRVEDYDNTKGMGWRLVAEGKVSREVRGFPDDVSYQGDASYSTIKGWITSGTTASASVQSFTIANDLNAATCADEVTDYSSLTSNFGDIYDTEPDLFHVSAPGLSCSFVFDGTASHNIKILSYRDYAISYTLSSGKITSFTITNEMGIKYFFDRTGSTTHYTDGAVGGVDVNTSNLEVFRRDFIMYRKKGSASMSYNSEWLLTKIEDTKGNRIKYDYEGWNINNPTVYKKWYSDPVEILVPNGSGGFTKKTLFTYSFVKTESRLTAIKIERSGADYTDVVPLGIIVKFKWAASLGGNQDNQLIGIDIPGESPQSGVSLDYTKKFIKSGSTYWNSFGRFFLKGVKRYGVGCEPAEYKFTYYDVDEATNACYCTPTNSSGVVVDTIVNAQDYYGYYNGAVNNTSLNPTLYVYPSTVAETYKINTVSSLSGSLITISGADRSVNSSAVKGTLKRITYPNGGIAELEYENNDFYDKDVNGIVLGGGIRVKKITRNDGLNTNEMTSYTYNNPSTGVSSGKITSVPKFAIGFPNTTSYATMDLRVKNSTYLSTSDLNTQPHTVYYGFVTVEKQGGGKAIYEYNNDGGFLDNALTYWQENINYIARSGSLSPCTAMAPAFYKPYQLQYPFAPNSNYDFERGLLKKVTYKTTYNAEVGSEEYTYAGSHSAPTVVYGLRLDYSGSNVKAYSKYAVNAVYDKFLVTKVTKQLNSDLTTGTVQTQEDYVYTSPSSADPFRLLKETRTTNSDGVTFVNRMKYAKEYTGTSSSGDDMTKALDYFKTNNINPVIETSQSKIESSVERWLGATVSTYKSFVTGFNGIYNKYLPHKSFSFVNQAGASSFSFSSISSNTFIKDAAYVNPPAEIIQYNTNGTPLHILGSDRNNKTILTSINTDKVIAEFSDAKPESIIYDNFDFINDKTSLSNYFVGGSAGGFGGGTCMILQPDVYLYKQVVKPVKNQYFIVSFWAKDADPGAQAIVAISTSPHSATGPNYITLATGSTWKYYELKLDVKTLNQSFGQNKYINFSGTGQFKIDNVVVAPMLSGYTHYSYTGDIYSGDNQKLTAKTGINGMSTIYDYDMNRVVIVRDQYNNIVERKKYMDKNITPQAQPTSAGVGTSLVGSKYVNVPVNFGANYSPTSSSCAPGFVVKYTWDYGDGSFPEITYTNTSVHTYTATGTYPVTVTVEVEGFNPVSSSPLSVVVVSSPPASGGTPVICAAGVTQLFSNQTCTTSTCSGMPVSCTQTWFTLTGITGGNMGAVKTVVWQSAPLSDPGNWGDVYTTTNANYQLMQAMHPIHITSYVMRAKITFLDNSVAYSNSITIKNGD